MVTTRQRLAAVVAAAAVCGLLAAAVNQWLDHRAAVQGGWFNYAPNNGLVFSPARSWPLRPAAVWSVAVLAWAGLAFLLLRRADDRPDPPV
jgi:hypothetical protein